MIQLTGLEYLEIDIANNYGNGLDKKTWSERLAWVRSGTIKTDQADADEPELLAKAMNAYQDAKENRPSGHLMGLDATASGIQLLACLSGCHKTAAKVNLINTGKREDVYESTAEHMSNLCGHEISRKMIKHPIMTYFYNSKAEPKAVFGEDTPELDAFYQTLKDDLPGACEAMEDIQSCWNPNAPYHEWYMPDGHYVRCDVMVPVKKKIEVAELDKATFTYQMDVIGTSKYGVSLPANVTHSVDAYVCREMVRRCRFNLLTIHDNFLAHPNNMQAVRQTYLDILIEIAESDLLQSILRQITGNTSLTVQKLSNDLGKAMKDAEYALS